MAELESLGTAAVDEPFPSKDSDHVLQHAGFRITTRKLPILKAGPIEDMTTKLGIAPPEMIFGDNLVQIQHVASGWTIELNAFDALDKVDKTGSSMLAVSYSKEWQESRERKYGDQDIKGVVKPFDWSYSTDYAGTVSTTRNGSDMPDADSSNPGQRRLTRTSKEIPLALLARRDPILFFDDVVLYEDELADNGIAMLSAKIRVMPQRLLLLQRFFMRLDDVVFRIRDTRVYVEFETARVMREYCAREEGFEQVRNRFAGRKDGQAAMREPGLIAEAMPVIERWTEELVLE